MSTLISKGVVSTLATLPSSTLSANITSSQTFIPVTSTTNFSSYTTAKIASTSEIVTYTGVGTNNILFSQDYTNANWDKYSGNTVTANVVTAPDGTNTGSRISGGRLYQYYLNYELGKTYTISAYAYGTVGQTINISRYNPGSDVDMTGQAFTLTSDWQRFSYTFTATADSLGNGRVAISGLGGGGSPAGTAVNYYLWGCQLETASSAGMYVATTSTSLSALTGVTRGANSTTAAAATSGATVTVIDNNINKSHFVNCVATAGATTIRVTDIGDTTLGELYLHNSGDSIIVEKSPSDNILLVGGAAKVNAVGSPRS
jgi:hypothetical protein